MSQETIYNNISNISTKHYQKGSIIFHEGESSDEKMYYIIEGSLSILKKTPDGEKKVGELNPGAFFGEMALVTTGLRAATIKVSSEKAKLGVIDKEVFKLLAKSSPGFLLSLLRSVVKNFSSAEDKIKRLENEVQALKEGKSINETVDDAIHILESNSAKDSIPAEETEDNPYLKAESKG